jgi:hypothetical protein
MYREVQRIRDDIQSVQRAVRAGILADVTRDVSGYTSEAMAQIDALINSLSHLPPGDNQGVEPALIGAAQRALNLAWARSERVGLGSSVPEMREALVDCKTYVDYAEAYVAASLGVELEQ